MFFLLPLLIMNLLRVIILPGKQLIQKSNKLFSRALIR